ncbi:hypothetical protein EDD36DRAFT_254004 [Exophiala viscosa]|uniref:Uncharacterized protein n=1 Tax=Exophiala viscosa TaxID=2486360 RepID=A0AAN6ID36_9EURO|nr:hypothetical protein EDD36DRAFT_254004 [Exophiala viscosa]
MRFPCRFMQQSLLRLVAYLVSYGSSYQTHHSSLLPKEWHQNQRLERLHLRYSSESPMQYSLASFAPRSREVRSSKLHTGQSMAETAEQVGRVQVSFCGTCALHYYAIF